MTPTPPRTTTASPARAKIEPRLRPLLTPACASAVGLGSPVEEPSSNVGCETGTGLTLMVGSTGSGRVEPASSGVSSGSGVRDLGDSDSVGSTDSVGAALGLRVREGEGLAVSVGQTIVPQEGRGVADLEGLGLGLGSADSVGAGCSDALGDGVSCARSARDAALSLAPTEVARPASERAATSQTAGAARRTPVLVVVGPTLAS